ncbi:MAG: thioredoxin domain-containing protein [Candidatus Buchananbacteria bacterium]|nr:thioredoxin domain-containing protein [Candidatus Buchananbacteria bacterium]
MLIPINNQENWLNRSALWLKKKWTVALIVIIILLIVLIALIFLSGDQSKNNQPTLINITNNLPASDPKRQMAEKRDRPHFGNENAKLVIVEFSDFQCPVCQAQFPTIREIVNKYKDDIFFIYRQYPIINDNSPVVSMASLCAYEQDKFWPMHDRLFLNPSDNFSGDDLKNIARQSGLDLEKFNSCLTSEKYKNMVTEDTRDGFDLGVPGTPTFFINGDRLSGNISKENWDIIISQSLKLLNNQK